MPNRSFSRLPIVPKTLLVCLMLVPVCAASNHRDYEDSRDEVRDFVSGGMVHVRLSVGDLRIVRGGSSKIRVHYTVESNRESTTRNARLDFEVHGRDANIEFHVASGNNTDVHAEIEVPQNTNLDVHEKVGDVTVENIEGDKDLELSVGDIRVEVERSAYHLVRASTSIGDVNGDGYGETSGWLGKTLKYRGEGKYELRAHVSVGDISLEGK